MRHDPVTPLLRDAILERDGQCVAALLDRSHQCRDAFAQPHSPFDRSRLTIEHVKDEPMMGRRAPSDPMHLTVLCWSANVIDLWGSANRDLVRAYLMGCAASMRTVSA